MPNILLREVIDSDLPILFEQQIDPEATHMAALPSRDRDAFMAHWAKILHDETIVIKVIIFEGHVAGYALSFVIAGEREVGYWLGKEYWGKGIATKALAEFLPLVKERPLYAQVAKHNIASRRVLEKCGFEISGDAKFPDENGNETQGFKLKLET